MLISQAQLAALRAVCEKLAYVSGGSLPPDLESATSVVSTLSTLAGICGKRVSRGRQANDELREVKQELENVERLKARFVSNVSHEMRTPLACIDGFARALLQMEQRDEKPPGNGAQPAPSGLTKGSNAGLNGQSTAEMRRQFLMIISQEAQRLGKLIEDVLDLSDVEAARRRQAPTLFTARELFDETLGTLRAVQFKPDVVVRVKPEGDSPAVFADRPACVEILRQLLVNADRFSGSQEIVLGAELVSIRPAHAAGASESGMRERVSSATQLYVRDKGVGIPREELPYVFDKFYRGERAASAFPGTGLGLAMVRALVNQNDGRVWADSAPGRGSTFYVLLPSHAPGNHH